MNQDLQHYQYLQDAQKFQCSEHPDCQMKAVDLGQQSNFKSRILCLQCILNYQDKNTNSVFQIRELLVNPMKIVDKIMEQDSSYKENYLIYPNMIEKLMKQLKKFKALIIEQIKSLKKQLDEYKSSKDQNETRLLQKLRIYEFQELFTQVWQMDTHQGTKEYQKLQEYFDWLALNIRQTVKTQINEYFSSRHQISKFRIEFYDQTQQIDKSLKLMDAINIPPEIIDFPEIHLEISQGKLLKYELIYQGSVHGLNSKSYWEKVNNQSHLLTFMTSKNGNQFGGYSPLKLNISAQYLNDENLRTFIFQYTKKEIYKQKVKNDTIYCQKDCGPVFGTRSGNDILILSDFQSGHSQNLGDHFDISKYNVENQMTHIFGDLSPNLIECKVYKITFY